VRVVIYYKDMENKTITLSAPAKSGYKKDFDSVESARAKAADLLDCAVDEMVEVEMNEVTYCYASQEDADADLDGAYAVQYYEAGLSDEALEEDARTGRGYGGIV
jgi:hypothetical protein